MGEAVDRLLLKLTWSEKAREAAAEARRAAHPTSPEGENAKHFGAGRMLFAKHGADIESAAREVAQTHHVHPVTDPMEAGHPSDVKWDTVSPEGERAHHMWQGYVKESAKPAATLNKHGVDVAGLKPGDRIHVQHQDGDKHLAYTFKGLNEKGTHATVESMKGVGGKYTTKVHVNKIVASGEAAAPKRLSDDAKRNRDIKKRERARPLRPWD